MLIWKGHGILILVFGILGGLLGGAGAAAAYAATHWEWMLRMVGPANLWGASMAIALYGRTIGKTISKTYLDPATRLYVDIKTSHSFFFIPAIPWAVLVAVMASVSTVRSFTAPAVDFMSDSQLAAAAPAKAAFKEANRLIDMDQGKTAYGNTPDAEKLAAGFSAVVMKGRELGVEKGRKSTISLSHGKFLSYCRLNPDSCVFMVHVPDLRKFTDDAKKFMVGMAWTVAREQVAELRPQPKTLVVGVRGAFLYDEVVEGPVAKARTERADDEDWQAGIERRFSTSNATDRLELYFEPHAAGALLPSLGAGPAEEPEKKNDSPVSPMAAAPAGGTPSTPSAAAAPAISQSATTPNEKLAVLLKWFPTVKAGDVAGNADPVNRLALQYAGLVHGRVAVNPALGGLALPSPFFSAYVHLRDDTAAFFLGVPSGSNLDLSPAAFKSIQDTAWMVAAMASAQMSPVPARIVVTTFKDGEMDMTRIGSPQDPKGTQWRIEQELAGEQGREVLPPFLAAFSKPLITVKPNLALRPVKSQVSSAPPVPTTAAAPAPARVLPTAVRDWKDATGRVMQASLESFTTLAKDAGRFKRADGQVFEVPFARLSAEDQAYIKGLAAP
ncbi:hypothetical protein [Prosthecobacter sp.]|uniref:hypothetical protein n=1 Tax=Prosthecobacter sp. TaxID=1965333 RepID=UPI0037846D63